MIETKRMNSKKKLDELPREVFLQIVLFSSKSDIFTMLRLNKTINSYFSSKGQLFWKQLCILSAKGDDGYVEKYKNLYRGGYKEMYLSGNMKRFSNHCILFEKKFTEYKTLKEFDEKNSTNIANQFFKFYQDADGEAETIEELFDEDEEWFLEEGAEIYIFGVKKEREEEYTVENYGKTDDLSEIISPDFPKFMFLQYEEGGNYFGAVFLENEPEQRKFDYTDQFFYIKTDMLLCMLCDVLYSCNRESRDGNEYKFKTFGEFVKEKTGKTDNFIFSDLHLMLPSYEQKKAEKTISFM